MNPHLYRALEQAGRIRYARWSTCRHCAAPVITGLDADILAYPAECDPTHIDTLGETLAIATGRYTVTVTVKARRAYLDYRDRWRIRGHPAEHVDVLAEHRCGTPLPQKPHPPRPDHRTNTTNEPPF